MGRKSIYESKVLPKFADIKKWRESGQTEQNIAKLCGVAYPTFCLYKRRYPDFCELLKTSKEVLIENLEHTMFEMALGHISVKETKKFIQQSIDGKQNIRIEETTKELGPNATLLIFSLKNLASEKWNEKSLAVVDVNGAMNNMQTVFTELKEKLNTFDNKDLKNEVNSDNN